MTSTTAPIAQPLPYRHATVVSTAPPLVVSIAAVMSLAVAVATIALCAWSLTHAYYMTPPAPVHYWSPASVVSEHQTTTPRRVTVAEGDAIIDGLAQLIP